VLSARAGRGGDGTFADGTWPESCAKAGKRFDAYRRHPASGWLLPAG
jgi:hypothetical protein